MKKENYGVGDGRGRAAIILGTPGIGKSSVCVCCFNLLSLYGSIVSAVSNMINKRCLIEENPKKRKEQDIDIYWGEGG